MEEGIIYRICGLSKRSLRLWYVEMGREDIEDKASAYTWAMLVLRKDGMGSVLYYFRPFHFKCFKGSVITKLGLLQ